MLKLNPKILIIILIALAVAFALIRFTSDQGKSKSLRSELVNFEIDKVTEVVISTEEKSLTLLKSGENWQVLSEGKSYAADPQLINGMLATLKSLVPDRLASRNEAKWEEFAVDEQGTRVTVKMGKNVGADVALGRLGMEGQRSFFTYARAFDEKDTYVCPNFMKMSIYENPAEYRYSQVLQINRDSLLGIDFQRENRVVNLVRDGATWYAGNQQADSVSIENLLRSIGYLSSRSFAEIKPSGTPSMTATFKLTNGKTHQLQAWESEETVIFRSSANEYEWFDDATIQEKIVVPLRALTNL